MGRIKTMALLGALTAAGSVLGMTAYPRKPRCGAIIGAVAGIAAGTVLSGMLDTDDGGNIRYYSTSLPLYENADEVGYI